MCTNLRKTRRKKVIGWKVVGIKPNDPNHYSILTGNRYPPKGGKIPIWSEVNQPFGWYYNYELLDKKGDMYKSALRGRTGAFASREAGYQYLRSLKHYDCTGIVVVKVELTEDLLLGDLSIEMFGPQHPVYVGRRMRVLERVEA